ncbi:hypothetical protein SKAU_G00103690 [Synaphobranchus kaupii]|uniref:Uncharacterized protein n=1 Tax=Synaphobranchus kaupii TaxID=118154 RepID=A0A9Q1G019_SYNKA|nr:hypothetical protein SKAU_G00103690 [Synaphobranchus kaupii]
MSSLIYVSQIQPINSGKLLLSLSPLRKSVKATLQPITFEGRRDITSQAVMRQPLQHAGPVPLTDECSPVAHAHGPAHVLKPPSVAFAAPAPHNHADRGQLWGAV